MTEAPKLVIDEGTVVEEVDYIAARLRHEDVKEAAAWGMTPADVFQVGIAHQHCWTAYLDTPESPTGLPITPLFVAGISGPLLGTAQLWGYGTTLANDYMRGITKYFLRTLIPYFFDKLKLNRLEVRVPVSSAKSLRWLVGLGFNVECTLHHYSSATHEPFIQLSYTRTDFERDYPVDVFLQQSQSSSATNGSTHEDVGRNPS